MPEDTLRQLVADGRRRLSKIASQDPALIALTYLQSLDSLAATEARGVDADRLEFLRFGHGELLKALVSHLPDHRYQGFPLFRAPDEAVEYVADLWIGAAELGHLEYLLDLHRSRVLELTQDGQEFEFTLRRPTLEWIDNVESQRLMEELSAAQSPNYLRLGKAREELQDTMSDLVWPWREHFIGYDADPDVDELL